MAEYNPFQFNPFRRMPMGITVDTPDIVSPYKGLAEYLLDRPVFDRGKRTDDPLASFRDRNDEKQAMRSVEMDFEGLENQYQNLVKQFEDAKKASYEDQRGADEEVKRIANEIARVEALIGPAIDPDLLKEDLRKEILAGIPEPTDIDPDLLKEELRQDLIEAMPDQEALVAQIIADLPDDSVELQAMIDSLREELKGLISDMPDIEALRAELMGLIPDAPDLEGLRSSITQDILSQVPEAQDLSPLEQQIADVMSRLDAMEAQPDASGAGAAPDPSNPGEFWTQDQYDIALAANPLADANTAPDPSSPGEFWTQDQYDIALAANPLAGTDPIPADPPPASDPVDYTTMSADEILNSIGAPGTGFDFGMDPFDQFTGQEPFMQSLAAQSAATQPAETQPAETMLFTPLPEEAEAFLPETVRATPSRRTIVEQDVGLGGRGGQGMYF